MRLLFSFLITLFGLSPYVNAKDADCFENIGEVKFKSYSNIIKTKRLWGKKISIEDLAVIYLNRGNTHFKKKEGSVLIKRVITP